MKIAKAHENEIFPGQYRSKADPKKVVRVTRVRQGLVSLEGIEGPVKSALMSCMTFMCEYERIDR